MTDEAGDRLLRALEGIGVGTGPRRKRRSLDDEKTG